MTDVVRYSGHPATNGDMTPVQQAADYTSWAPKLSSAAAIAREISNTEFVPTALRGKPAAVTAAILAGSEIGIGPMASLNQIHVIEGRPALSAELIRALVLAHGHHIRYREMTTHRCTVEGRRRDTDDWTTVTWTMDDAKAAGLQGRQNWRRYPRRMLAARATSELGRLVFADVLGGMAWSAEELEDESDDVAVDGTQPAKRTAKRKTATKRRTSKPKTESDAAEQTIDTVTQPTSPEPPLPDDDPTDDADQAPDVMVTDPQMTKLQAIFTEHGIDRAERLAISSGIVGRRLDTAKQLTLHEAGVLIDTIERAAQSGDMRAALLQLLEAQQQDADGDQPDDEEDGQ